MTVLVLAALAALIVLGVLGAVLARRGMRRLRHRAAAWKSRVIEFRAQLLPPGPRRDAALLRSTLDAELRATCDMLGSAPQGLIFRADAAAVLRELVTAAVELDRELAAIERFRDQVEQRAALATVNSQVRELIDTTYTARHTILRTAVEDRERQLASLRASVAQQAAALDTYQRNRREPSI